MTETTVLMTDPAAPVGEPPTTLLWYLSAKNCKDAGVEMPESAQIMRASQVMGCLVGLAQAHVEHLGAPLNPPNSRPPAGHPGPGASSRYS